MKTIFLVLLSLLLLARACIADVPFFPKTVREGSKLVVYQFGTFSKILARMNEPVLWKEAKDKRTTEFRVVNSGLLGIGGPAGWRLRVEKDGSGTWTAIDLSPFYLAANGKSDISKPYGKPIRKTFKVPKKSVDAFLNVVERNRGFWTTPTFVDEPGVISETSILMEGVQNGKYQCVMRTDFPAGPADNISTALTKMVELSARDFPELQQNNVSP